MNLDDPPIDWPKTTDLVRSALAPRGKVAWVAAQLAERFDFSESSKSELYALSKNRPFKLSNRKWEGIFEVLEITPVRIGRDTGDPGRRTSRLSFCRNVHCRECEWELVGMNGWIGVPAPQWLVSDDEKHCRFCGEKDLIQSCPSPKCGHPLVDGSHCPKCGGAYAPIDEEQQDELRALLRQDQTTANESMLWRKIHHLFPGSPNPGANNAL